MAVSTPRILSVREITFYLKELLEEDRRLANVWVRGEISNFKDHASGHLYFTLKDNTTSLRCVMFRRQALSLTFQPDNGIEVVARGYINVYEKEGRYQLYTQELQPGGVGSIYLAFMRLKQKLEAEGLFLPQLKRPLPFLPRCVGLITSPTGAVIRDMVRIIKRRSPQTGILFAPAGVQGETAMQEIAAALELLNRNAMAEVIILGRGGGSFEELGAFNSELVARAIRASRIPVVTAIGHETDFTIADFAADYRAATPSEAAELVVPSQQELAKRLVAYQQRLAAGISRYLQRQRDRYRPLVESRVLRRPESCFDQDWQRLDTLVLKHQMALAAILQKKKEKFVKQATSLDALSPLAVLGRGYALCCELDTGKIITSGNQISPGGRLEVILKKGILDCIVTETRETGDDGRN